MATARHCSNCLAPLAAAAPACPHCGAGAAPARARVVARPVAPPPMPARRPAPRRRDEEYDDRPRRREPDSSNLGMILGAVVAGGAFMAVGVVVLHSALKSDRPAPVAAPPAEVASLPAVPAPAPVAAPPASWSEPSRPAMSPASESVPSPAPAPAPSSYSGLEPPAPRLAPPPSNADAVTKVKHSTVFIACQFADSVGMGSGFFAGPPGYVVTNAHVVGYRFANEARPTRIQVALHAGKVDKGKEKDRKLYDAKLLGYAPQDDLALLRIEGASELPPPLRLAKSEELTETQQANIFGYPRPDVLGAATITVSTTTVTGLKRLDDGRLQLVQVGSGMASGNSGGPMANAAGDVIGVSVGSIRDEEINFGIPTEAVTAFLDRMKGQGWTGPPVKIAGSLGRARFGPEEGGGPSRVAGPPPGVIAPPPPRDTSADARYVVGTGAGGTSIARDAVPAGMTLVGLEIAQGPGAASTDVMAVRAIYRNGSGADSPGQWSGRRVGPPRPTVTLKAKPGYAVLNVRVAPFGARVLGVGLTFGKLAGARFDDAAGTYDSEWAGGARGKPGTAGVPLAAPSAALLVQNFGSTLSGLGLLPKE